MHAIIAYALLVCGLFFFLFGCVTQEQGLGYYENITTQQNITGTAGNLQFSVPAQLPDAYVGKQYSYSFKAAGGKPPYEFDYEIHRIVYDGSVDSSGSSFGDLSTGEGRDEISSEGELTFIPQSRQEGQYLLMICVTDSSWNKICRNATIYVLSDVVKVKGNGSVSAEIIWDPRGYVQAGEKDYISRPNTITPVPISEISNVSLSSSKSAQGKYGGASVSMNMAADQTTVSISANGYAGCGKDPSPTWQLTYMDDFIVGEEKTYIGLNITNNGTMEKIVDITVSGSSSVSADSMNYYTGGVNINIRAPGDLFKGSSYVSSMQGTPRLYSIASKNDTEILIKPPSVQPPGTEIKESKTFRVTVTPGNHVVWWMGTISPYLWSTLGIKGCPSSAQITGKATITVADADLSDGKKPIGKIGD
jgi:hypothetical protein